MNRRTGSMRMFGLCATLSMGALLALSSFAYGEQEDRVLLDDARVTGRDIRVYDLSNGQQVMIVQGNFRLAVGRRSVMGNNAVLWIKDRTVGGATIHEMVIYAEGHAVINEGEGTTMTDRTRVVTMSQQGRLSVAKVQPGEGPLEENELYIRAQDARDKIEHPGMVTTRPTTGPATRPSTQPAIVPMVFDFQDVTVYNLPALAKRLANHEPLTDTEKFLAQQAACYPKMVRALVMIKPSITIGEPHESQYMTMTAETAVAYTEKGVEKELARTPASIKLLTLSKDEAVTGVYLDNTVVITQGDKKLTASRVFYDFTRDRAMLINMTYKTILYNRNVPLYMRAEEARQVNAREIVFKDATVSTSDFHTPSYAIASKEMRVQDKTLYNEEGRPISERTLTAQACGVTYEVYGIPILYWPKFDTELEQNHSPLRHASIGTFGNMGNGVETEWDFFRLLGMARPTGVEANLEADFYNRGVVVGLDVKYARSDERRDFYGYAMAYEVYDAQGQDNFGQNRQDIPAPTERGRILSRHKEFLPSGWEIQFELSYLSDRNFLQEFFRNEFWAGKEQETLLYAKKQQDNWAFTSLLQYRLNSFLTQTNSFPDLSFYLIGQPLADGQLTFFSENHAGLKQWKPANYLGDEVDSSNVLARGDTRNEIDAPMHWGPLNFTPYAQGRLTAWSEAPPAGGVRVFGPPNAEGGISHAIIDPTSAGDTFRPYGQVGMRMNTHIWQVYEGVENRFWDLNGLKHIMTPEALAWVGATGVEPSDLFPMDPSIEQFLGQNSGAAIGMHQRLQTKRGEPGKMETVDWMRLSVFATFVDTPDTNDQPSVGTYYFSRPEYSRGPNAIIADYAWNISDSTAFLSDINITQQTGKIGQFDAGFAVSRDPRVRYYLGVRMIDDLNTTLGVFGVNYKLNQKYTLSLFEQYDFQFNGGQNLLTTLSIIRKFPRWYGGVSLVLDQTQNNIGLYFTVWPEGMPEVTLGTGRLSPLGNSTKN